MTSRVLLVAKAPVPGRAKTRLGAVVGMDAAADLAAAALLDTAESCEAAFGTRPVLALDGDLASAARGEELVAAFAGWAVFPQCDGTFADRLVHAHRVLGGRPGVVVQIGMDTPQVTPRDLRDVAGLVASDEHAALAPAEDGGWWALALVRGDRLAALRQVPMSTGRTGALTARALAESGFTVATGSVLRDVDTVADAHVVARAAPATRFARAWSGLVPVEVPVEVPA